MNFGNRGPQVGIACVGLVERVKDWLVYDAIFHDVYGRYIEDHKHDRRLWCSSKGIAALPNIDYSGGWGMIWGTCCARLTHKAFK